MKALRIVIIGALVLSLVGAGAATLLHLGAETIGQTQTVSLRQESARAPHGVYFYGHTHQHMGGGLHGGK